MSTLPPADWRAALLEHLGGTYRALYASGTLRLEWGRAVDARDGTMVTDKMLTDAIRTWLNDVTTT